MEEIILTISRTIPQRGMVDEEKERTTRGSYDVALDGNVIFSLETQEIATLFNKQPTMFEKHLNRSPRIRPFQELISSKGSNLITRLGGRIKLNLTNSSGLLLRIQSQEVQFLGLPWESVLLEGDLRLIDFNNILVVRSFSNFDQAIVDIQKNSPVLLFTSFSKCEDDVISEIKQEICEIIEAGFLKLDIFTDILHEEFLRLVRQKSYQIIHFTGHANSTNLSISDGVITANDFKEITTSLPLIFLNGCSTAQEQEDVTSFVCKLIKEINVRFVVGMQYKSESVYAKDFSRFFYKSLLDQKDIYQSFLKAKKMARPTNGFVDNIYPVLYQG